MAGLQVSGLVSNIDTTSIISQLMEVESNPQTLLKNQLTSVQADAAAYRAVNTRFAALQTAATAVTAATAWTATKASSSDTTVVATAGTSAVPGSLSFHVEQLATNHALLSKGAGWTGTDKDFGATSIDLTIGTTTTTIPITRADGKAPRLADAISAINGSGKNITATAVQIAPGEYQLQVTANSSGAAGKFDLGGPAVSFDTLTAGQDAQLTIGTTTKRTVTSSSNTFAALMGDTTITVSRAGVDSTVTVTSDPSATASKVKSLVDNANSLLAAISSYTDAGSSTAILKGDSTLRGLSGQILDMVSSAVGGSSASVAGLEITKDGKLTFDAAVFTAKLTSDPATVQKIFTSTTSTVDATGKSVTNPVGIAAKLESLAKGAADTSTGTLTLLATSEDSLAKDLQTRIDDWDVRLQMRKDALTAQFTAMTTALSSLQNQSSWLTSALASLPGSSQTSSKS